MVQIEFDLVYCKILLQTTKKRLLKKEKITNSKELNMQLKRGCAIVKNLCNCDYGTIWANGSFSFQKICLYIDL